MDDLYIVTCVQGRFAPVIGIFRSLEGAQQYVLDKRNRELNPDEPVWQHFDTDDIDQPEMWTWEYSGYASGWPSYFMYTITKSTTIRK